MEVYYAERNEDGQRRKSRRGGRGESLPKILRKELGRLSEEESRELGITEYEAQLIPLRELRETAGDREMEATMRIDNNKSVRGLD